MNAMNVGKWMDECLYHGPIITHIHNGSGQKQQWTLTPLSLCDWLKSGCSRDV